MTTSPLSEDEKQIRQLVATWLTASKAGDIDTVLSLLTDDVVFLGPGRPPMHKDEFAAAMRAQAGQASPKIDGSSDIREIEVMGDRAFMWTALRVVATPPDGSPAITRAGHTLSILKKVNGQWRLARDANMLALVAAAKP
jgi:uncharacterized protein (TIGR02246 family)